MFSWEKKNAFSLLLGNMAEINNNIKKTVCIMTIKFWNRTVSILISLDLHKKLKALE